MTGIMYLKEESREMDKVTSTIGHTGEIPNKYELMIYNHQYIQSSSNKRLSPSLSLCSLVV